jgi:hypothetical protein
MTASYALADADELVGKRVTIGGVVDIGTKMVVLTQLTASYDANRSSRFLGRPHPGCGDGYRQPYRLVTKRSAS